MIANCSYYMFIKQRSKAKKKQDKLYTTTLPVILFVQIFLTLFSSSKVVSDILLMLSEMG
jgi:hypothetical protein